VKDDDSKISENQLFSEILNILQSDDSDAQKDQQNRKLYI